MSFEYLKKGSENKKIKFFLKSFGFKKHCLSLHPNRKKPLKKGVLIEISALNCCESKRVKE
jgi:hypothetical protein